MLTCAYPVRCLPGKNIPTCCCFLAMCYLMNIRLGCRSVPTLETWMHEHDEVLTILCMSWLACAGCLWIDLTWHCVVLAQWAFVALHVGSGSTRLAGVVCGFHLMCLSLTLGMWRYERYQYLSFVLTLPLRCLDIVVLELTQRVFPCRHGITPSLIWCACSPLLCYSSGDHQ